MRNAVRPAGAYGVDAPWVPLLWSGLCAGYAALAVLAAVVWGVPWWAVALLSAAAAGFGAGTGLYWHATLRGKFVVWARVLAALPAGRYDRVVDLGCGHGAVAIQAALRVPGSRVLGVDLWRSADQSGNSPLVTRANAAASGVAGRVTVATADLRALPCPDGAFGLVLASLSIHNIPTAQGRAQAVREAWRVLAPGGLLVIADIQRTGEYLAALRDCGAETTGPEDLGWRAWWSGPWMPTRMLRAVKQASPGPQPRHPRHSASAT